MTAELDPARFAEWLRARGYSEVGIAGKECDCPLARWAREDLGWGRVEVGSWHICSRDENGRPHYYDLPFKLVIFVQAVDRGGGGQPIYADQALTILEALP